MDKVTDGDPGMLVSVGGTDAQVVESAERIGIVLLIIGLLRIQDALRLL